MNFRSSYHIIQVVLNDELIKFFYYWPQLMGMILNNVVYIDFLRAIWLSMFGIRGSIELSYNSRRAKRIAFIGDISGFSVVLCIAL